MSSALQKCPDCDRDISKKAPACPHCGRPQTRAARSGASNDQRIAAWLFGPLFLILLFVAVYLGWVDPQPIVRFLMAQCAGFFTYFLAGTVRVAGRIPGAVIRATGGVAVYLLLQIWINPLNIAQRLALDLGFENITADTLQANRPVRLQADLVNRSQRVLEGSFVVQWLSDDSTILSDEVSLNLSPSGRRTLYALWKPPAAGPAKITLQVQQGDKTVADHDTVVQVAPRIATAPPPLGETTLAGRWFLRFIFQRNSGKPEELPRPWFAFVTTFQQAGDSVSARLEAQEVDGVVQGVLVDNQLNGVLRLRWDQYNWESFRLAFTRDRTAASGSAVFRDLQNGEVHEYTLALERLP